jgi:hypothetical protein
MRPEIVFQVLGAVVPRAWTPTKASVAPLVNAIAAMCKPPLLEVLADASFISDPCDVDQAIVCVQ